MNYCGCPFTMYRLRASQYGRAQDSYRALNALLAYFWGYTHKHTHTDADEANKAHPTTMAPSKAHTISKRTTTSMSTTGVTAKRTRSGKTFTTLVKRRKTKPVTAPQQQLGLVLSADEVLHNANESEDEREEGSESDSSDGEASSDALEHVDRNEGNEDVDDDASAPCPVVAPPNVTTPVSSITSSKSTTDDYESPLPRVIRQVIFPKVKFIGEGDEGQARLQFNTAGNSMCALILEHCGMAATDAGEAWWKSVRPQIRGLLSGIRNNALKSMSSAYGSKCVCVCVSG